MTDIRTTHPRPTGPSNAPLAVLFPAWQDRPLALLRALYGTFPVFRTEFDTVCWALERRLRLPLAAVVFAPEDGVDGRRLRGTEYGPPALFAYEVALYRLWHDWGVRAVAVAGDGIGAITAGHVSGRLDLYEAVARLGGPHRPRSPGAEHRLLAAGYARVLECGPGDAAPTTVGDTSALVTALARLQLSGQAVDRLHPPHH